MMSATKSETVQITCKINGKEFTGRAEPRMLLVHFIRDELNLTGTHIGCDTGHCGACTIMMNGKTIKSCMALSYTSRRSEYSYRRGLGAEREASSVTARLSGKTTDCSAAIARQEC